MTSKMSACIIKPNELKITWSGDKRYWCMPGADQEDKTAKLLQVSWLEVAGTKDLDHRKKYQIGFEVSLAPDAFGWGNAPVYVMAKRGRKGKYSYRKVNLAGRGADKRFIIPENLVVNEAQSPSDATIYFGLYEVWSGLWKGGLRIHHAFVKEVA